MPKTEEIDIAELSNEDLVYELAARVGGLRNGERKKLFNALSYLFDEFGLIAFPCETLDDEMKIEFLLENWDKFTSFQLEEKLK